MTATQRILAHYRSLGYECRVVERWNSFAKRRVDLWGADILARKWGFPMVAVQAKSGEQREGDRKRHSADALWWNNTGCVFELAYAAKRGGRGKRKLWTVTRVPL